MTKPLKWGRVKGDYNGALWKKYHACDNEGEANGFYGLCGRWIWMPRWSCIQVTADTPDEKDCCKKCYAKMKDEQLITLGEAVLAERKVHE